MSRILPPTRDTITIDNTTYYIEPDELINVENPHDTIKLYDSWGPLDFIEAEARAWGETQETIPV